MRRLKHSGSNKNTSGGQYNESDLEEFCLWLYGVYEETTLESN